MVNKTFPGLRGQLCQHNQIDGCQTKLHFSDGSGGAQAPIPQWAARVGAAAIGLAWDFTKEKVSDFNFKVASVQGNQTVPRSEVAAAMSGERLGSPSCGSDCIYAVKRSMDLHELIRQGSETSGDSFEYLDKTNGDL